MASSCGKERSSDSDKRQKQSRDRSSKRDVKVEKGAPQQSRAPMRTPAFIPKFGGRFYRPYFRKEDRFLRRPGFGFRSQRYSAALGARLHRKGDVEHSGPSPQVIQSNVKKDGNDSTGASADREHAQRTSKSTSQERDTGSHSATVLQEGGAIHGRALPMAVMQAAVRSRAIQEKRREIEEVYRQDCSTFETVVKMLIAKDPSLEQSLRLSLRKNLQDMGQHCVEAMEQFIAEYDSRDTPILPLPHLQTFP